MDDRREEHGIIGQELIQTGRIDGFDKPVPCLNRMRVHCADSPSMGFMAHRADSVPSTGRCRILIRDLQECQSRLVNGNRVVRSPGKHNARTRGWSQVQPLRRFPGAAFGLTRATSLRHCARSYVCRIFSNNAISRRFCLVRNLASCHSRKRGNPR